ncbi:pseudouridine synthase 1 isoform X3 [Rhipicephalus microplus]|uniref:pseudouridine synthase 1 isoform X3 n=1 Tax=Rhipicephalus microplus TaxID=6941 RepID=UPI003F6D8565
MVVRFIRGTLQRLLGLAFEKKQFLRWPFVTNIMSELQNVIEKKRALDDSGGEQDAKRLKSDIEAQNPELLKVKAKKMALCMCYNGKDYLGMQRNPGTKTIEEDLLTALYKGQLIQREHIDIPQNVKFQRAARTDKGVSAVRQVVSLKLPTNITIDEMVTRINSHLVDQIRVIDERIEEVNKVLALYKGCHNYHNFTSGKKSEDPSAMRFMISIECGQPFIQGDIEFLQIRIKGQSFMLHQIRKMVGLVIAIMRGHTDQSTIRRAWGPERLDIPIAPPLGLMLEHLHYDRYNKRYGGDGLHEPLCWEAKQDLIQAFKEKHIFPTIVETEKNEKSMLNWMENLPLHSYDVREPGPPTLEDAELCVMAGSDDDGPDDEAKVQDCSSKKENTESAEESLKLIKKSI